MGPSGSGKTTLLSMLGGMVCPTSGQITVDGVDLATLPESKLPEFRARRFGFAFQDFNLLPGAVGAGERRVRAQPRRPDGQAWPRHRAPPPGPLRRVASEQDRAVVIVSHDTRLKDIAATTQRSWRSHPASESSE
jgi:ABC-type lipoprotein export system ATPase subunit